MLCFQCLGRIRGRGHRVSIPCVTTGGGRRFHVVLFVVFCVVVVVVGLVVE